MKNLNTIILYAGILLIISSCVSNKKYQELIVQRDAATDEVAKLKVASDFRDYKISDVQYNKAMAMDSLNNLLKEENQRLDLVENDIKNALGIPLPKGISIIRNSDNIEVNFDEQILFPIGKTELNPIGTNVLTKFAKAFQNAEIQLDLMVVGHTDDQTYQVENFDNWDLSSQRSLNVVRLLQQSGVNPKQLIAAGRSQYDPAKPNTNATNRESNRRVEIILQPLVSPLDNSLEVLSRNKSY